MEIKTVKDAVIMAVENMRNGHEFYGNELKSDAVKLYPDAANKYVETFLHAMRVHCKGKYITIDKNKSLYRRVKK